MVGIGHDGEVCDEPREGWEGHAGKMMDTSRVWRPGEWRTERDGEDRQRTSALSSKKYIYLRQEEKTDV